MRTLLYVAFPKSAFTEKEALRFLRVRAFPQRLVASESVSRYWRAMVSEPTLGGRLYTIQDDGGPLFVFQEVENVEGPPDC